MSISFVLLIVCLIVIGYALRSSSKTALFPPTTAVCPNYWNIGPKAATCYKDNYDDCTTSNNRSSSRCLIFSSDEYSSLCKKQEWAKAKNVTWEGVTDVQSACT
jgi:hypothetical protein